MTTSNWTELEDDFLRDNWEKSTGKAIGRKLCRSRDSVLGRARRLGLPAKRKHLFGQQDG